MPVCYLQEEKRIKRKVTNHIINEMRYQKITHQDMSDVLGLHSRQTFDYQLHNMTFDVFQLTKIFKELKFDDKEILQLMKGE